MPRKPRQAFSLASTLTSTVLAAGFFGYGMASRNTVPARDPYNPVYVAIDAMLCNALTPSQQGIGYSSLMDGVQTAWRGNFTPCGPKSNGKYLRVRMTIAGAETGPGH